MTPTLEQFAAAVVASGLMTAEELAEFPERFGPEGRPRSAEELGKRLVSAGRLTAFQAGCIWRGKTKGLVLGEYVVLDKLGHGGMGMVMKARHRRMDRLVALKTLPPQSMRDPEAVQRFYREVKAAARLVHPNIVTAYDAGEHEGIHYLVMEYVEGQDLATLVKQHGPLPVAQALDCMLQVARGLAYAHSQGVIHRDIKPGNLLVDRQGVVKILDMGLARLVVSPGRHAETEEQLTASGQVMGTCDYMAPEQAVSTHRVDHRADIYSLGCTLYRLLTGEPPYTGQTLMDVLVAHREAPIPGLRAKRPDVSEELDGVFRRMVAKRPEHRYGTMEEVVGALEGCLGYVRAGVGGGEDSLSEGELSINAWLERILAPGGGQSAEGGVGSGAETLAHGPDHRTPTLVGGPGPQPPMASEQAGAAGQELFGLERLWQRLGVRPGRRPVLVAAVGLAAVVLVALAVVLLGDGGGPQAGSRAGRPDAGRVGRRATQSPAEAGCGQTRLEAGLGDGRSAGQGLGGRAAVWTGVGVIPAAVGGVSGFGLVGPGEVGHRAGGGRGVGRGQPGVGPGPAAVGAEAVCRGPPDALPAHRAVWDRRARRVGPQAAWGDRPGGTGRARGDGRQGPSAPAA